MCKTCDDFDKRIAEASAAEAWRVAIALEKQKADHIKWDHQPSQNVNVSGDNNQISVFGGDGSANVNITGNGNIFTGSGNINIRRGW